MMERAWIGVHRFVILREMTKEAPFQSFARLLESLFEERGNAKEIITAYHELAASLMEGEYDKLTGDRWKDFLLEALLEKKHPFSIMAACGKEDTVVYRAMEKELGMLQELFHIDNDTIRSWCKEKLAGLGERFTDGWVSWSAKEDACLSGTGALYKMKNKLAAAPDWSRECQTLWDFHGRYGYGDFVKNRVLQWNGEGVLEGVDDPDPVSMDDLIGYDHQKEELLSNTLRFLSGRPANNVLLYGDRGTGKSSMVKALTNDLADSPLRLVELKRDDLAEYLKVVKALKDQPLRFILFIDDLSFEEKETEYKSLKTLLEGGVAALPSNILVYATSNRRHLVKETFGDRGPEHLHNRQEEIFRADAIQEKLSLSDRFGITLTFSAPDRKQYLEMIDKMLQRRGINLSREEIQAKANEWELRFNGKSGRSADQLVRSLL